MAQKDTHLPLPTGGPDAEAAIEASLAGLAAVDPIVLVRKSRRQRPVDRPRLSRRVLDLDVQAALGRFGRRPGKTCRWGRSGARSARAGRALGRHGRIGDAVAAALCDQ
jgi:hypothetical protein